MNDVGSPVKNIFSKTALRMLNACGRFVWNFAQGFGIKIRPCNGSVVVSVDHEALLGTHAGSESWSIDIQESGEITETKARRKKRAGKSMKAAREDHVHPVLISPAKPKKDAGEGSRGTLDGDRAVLALADHVHPLNIGHTGDSYAAGNHIHTTYADKRIEVIVSTQGVEIMTLQQGLSALVEVDVPMIQKTVNDAHSTAEEAKNETKRLAEEIALILENMLNEEDVRASISSFTSSEEFTGFFATQDDLAERDLEIKNLTAEAETLKEGLTAANEDIDEIWSTFYSSTTGEIIVPDSLVEKDVSKLKGAAKDPSIGKSGVLVYSDHVHPFSKPVAPTGHKNLASGSGAETSTSAKSDSLNFTVDNTGGSLMIVSRVQPSGTERTRIWFRTMTISEDGRIASISKEGSFIDVYPA